MKQRLLFLTLNTFSATGGIEKVCRVAAKALHEIGAETARGLSVYSLYDANETDEAYLPAACFKGFAGRRLMFVVTGLLKGRKVDTVLLSHVNLLPVGYLIKKLSPKTKLALVAHGIEVWDKAGRLKKKMFETVDLFLPVSAFTAGKLQTVHAVPARKIQVLNNCLDPFLKKEKNAELEGRLRKKYGIRPGEFVLLTVTRLKFSEQYKGYDKVVKALQALKPSLQTIKYLIVGKWDDEEKLRLDAIVSEAGLNDAVIFAGFVNDEELSAHFTLADAYVMPSTGEGFGMVFIEALFYGLPVIAGNVDGSVDALAGGEFGLLVNPNSVAEIEQAIAKVYKSRERYVPVRASVVARFGFETYKANLAFALRRLSGSLRPSVPLSKAPVAPESFG